MIEVPTWRQLRSFHCSQRWTRYQDESSISNPYYEDAADRRYNASQGSDVKECRMIFLKGVLSDPSNKTLRRGGRFIWCRNLRYEGTHAATGLRQVSFTIDKGKKRFLVSENDMLCLPSHIYVSNNKYFRQKDKTFGVFSSVFSYAKTVTMMIKNYTGTEEEFKRAVLLDNPYRPGTLVSPRLGYFYPEGKPHSASGTNLSDDSHPYGIILGPSLSNSTHGGREFYRVRFGATTYEKVHPIEMEIVNEV
jgi:hypothetical protein